jgi:hypothetical protein
MRSTLIVLALIALVLRTAVSPSADSKPLGAEEKPKVVKEQVRGGIVFPAEKRQWTRITGKVEVVNAYTLSFADGTEVCLSGAIDVPELEQKGVIGKSFYPAGREAAEFLRKLIGDQPVTFLGDRQERVGQKMAGSCFVGETNLEIEMVRNGWAFSHHSGMDAWEIIAREHKRGLWRGQFVVPERWRKGERLPGEKEGKAEQPPLRNDDLAALFDEHERPWELVRGGPGGDTIRLAFYRRDGVGPVDEGRIWLVGPGTSTKHVYFEFTLEEKEKKRFIVASGPAFRGKGADARLPYELKGEILQINGGKASHPDLGLVELKGEWKRATK